MSGRVAAAGPATSPASTAVPLRVGDRVVGAVGVSGGSGEQDQTVAEAAAAF